MFEQSLKNIDDISLTDIVISFICMRLMNNRTVYHRGDISTLVGGDIIILERQSLIHKLF